MESDLKRAKKLLSQNKIDQAIGQLRSVIDQLNGQSRFVISWPAYHMMGIAFSQKGEHESSARYLRKALDLGSTEPETYHMLSVNYFNLAQFEKAEKYGKIAVEQKDDFLKAWLNLGSVYRAQAKLEESLKCFHKVNQLDPTNEDVAYRLGKIYRDLGDMEKAHQLFDFALKMNEGHARAFLEKADLYKNTGAFDKAKEYIEEARERYEQDTAANIALADIYRNEGDYDKALSLYKDILENADSDQHRSLVRINYALSLQEVSRFDESEKNYRQAIKEMPGSFHAISNYLMGLHYNPPNSKEYIFEEHLRLGKKFKQESDAVVPSNASKNKKLRVGFISGGFRRHPVGFMVTGALEQLSGDHIEVYCYTANNKHDFITRRIYNNVDQWKSVVGYNHDVVTKVIREDEIDILVDLTGHAMHSQLQVMARRPAPIIVKWVGGLFNTTGMEAFDYLISDWHESPEGEEEYYTEKLARLPDDYISYTPPAYAPDVGPLPAEENDYITFGCFNNPTKVNDEVLKQWAKIMNEVPNSRLYLKSKQYDTPSFREQITKVIEEQGIASERILFDGHSSHDDHLDAYNKVDVALDPWPYSGGLTTCESIYMGVPVITLPGPTFAGRHSTTHLMNAGLEEFVVDSWDEYIQKAIELAKDHDRLKQMRGTLRDQLYDSVVCDGKRFGAHLSAAFREMWKQWVDGYENDTAEWQDHIDVAPLSEVKIDKLTTGPDKTPLIKRQDKNTEESMELNKEKNINENKATNGEVSVRPQDKVCRIETADGVTVCTPDDLDLLTPYVLLEQQEWFEPELNFVRDYLQPGMKALDIGASFGTYALPMAKQVGKKGAVYAFEPGTIAKKHLERSKTENNFDQIEVISRAAGDEVSEVGFNIAETPELNTIAADGGQKISQTTIDAWWNFAGKPNMNLVKIDVNGIEQKVLEGASEVLKSSSPVVLVSIGDNGKLLSTVRKQLNDLGYDLFEYIPGPGLLAEHEPEAGVDGYLMNVIAVKQDSVDEFKELGWIFDEAVDVEAVDVPGWKGYIEQMPWAKSQLEKWEKQVNEQQHEEYLKALSLACAAEDMTISKDDSKARSRKGAMLLTAAQKLIGVLNSGKGSIPVALTFVRVMNHLGKREQALEMMKELMESLNSSIDPKTFLPFLPPLSEQDHTDIQTDFSKWLTVRVVEAWIKIKDVSTYMSDNKEREMLKGLEDNPEVQEWVENIISFTDEKYLSSVQENVSKISFDKNLNGNGSVRNRVGGDQWFKTVANLISVNGPVATRDNQLPKKLIVSLTSYPKRFENLPLTLLSLTKQTVRPDLILLWIAEEDKSKLTEEIKYFEELGVKICFCEDLKSYKKIIPTLKRYPDSYIVTADDDLYYRKNWLEQLIKGWDGADKTIVAHRAHRIKIKNNGKLKPYREWGWEFKGNGESSAYNFPTCGAGALYPPGIFHEDVLNVDKFRMLSPTADDIWLYWMSILNGAKVKIANNSNPLVEWPSSEQDSLWQENILEGKNDKQIQNLTKEYGALENIIGDEEREVLPSDVFSVRAVQGEYKIKLPDWKVDHIQKIIATYNKPYEEKMLMDMVNRTESNDLVVDVGGNIGNHALYMAAIGHCQVVSFEPNEHLFEAFTKSITLNNLSDKIDVIKKGLGSEVGHASFAKEIASNIGAQKLDFSNGEAGNIEVVTLDSVGIGKRIKLLKIDVEGMELEVLKGAKQKISQDRPIIYAEGATEKEFKRLNEFMVDMKYHFAKSFNATPTHLFLPDQ